MTRLPAHLSDCTGLLGSSAATSAGLPPSIIVGYITAWLIPVTRLAGLVTSQ